MLKATRVGFGREKVATRRAKRWGKLFRIRMFAFYFACLCVSVGITLLLKMRSQTGEFHHVFS